MRCLGVSSLPDFHAELCTVDWHNRSEQMVVLQIPKAREGMKLKSKWSLGVVTCGVFAVS